MKKLVDRSYAEEVAEEVIKLKQEICDLRDEITEIKVGKQTRKREKSCGNLKAAMDQQQFEEQGDKILEDVSSKLKCQTKIIDDERGIKDTVRSKCLGKTSKNKSHVILGEQNVGKLTFCDKQGEQTESLEAKQYGNDTQTDTVKRNYNRIVSEVQTRVEAINSKVNNFNGPKAGILGKSKIDKQQLQKNQEENKTGTWRNTIRSKQLLSDMLERNQPKPNRQLFRHPRSNQELNHVIFQDIVWELLLKLVCKGM